MKDERGVALLITLLVVALLTVTVVEFTYSVEVDQHLVRNSLSAMQAQMLARSGVNLGEAFLARDTNDPPADWYFEDWASPDIGSVIQLEPDERLKVQVVDEAGKININNTRPRRGAPPPQPGQPNLSPDAFLRDAMRRLFEANDIRVDIVDNLLEYWSQTPTPAPGQQDTQVTIDDFRSLEDFGAMFGIPARKVTKLRRFLTALPTGLDGARTGYQGRINANTAPVEVLTAVINDGARVDALVQRRDGDQPIDQAALNEALQGIEHQAQIAQLFTFTSSYFRVYASAMVGADPNSDRLGGVGQTVVALVNRRPIPGVPQDASPDTPRWTLTPLDWQKKGGAELLVRALQGDPGSEQTPTNGLMDERN